MEMQIQIPKAVLTALTQVYEMEQKLKRHGDPGNISRHLSKVKDAFAEEGVASENGKNRTLRPAHSLSFG